MSNTPSTPPTARDRWHPALADPPGMSAIELRFREALAIEYANGWSFYNRETRERLGDEAVRLNIEPILRAIKRASLNLTDVS